MSQTKYVLGEDAIPTHWVNLLPDLPGDPLPPLNPQTGQPAPTTSRRSSRWG
jgi:tryptophan synthase beta chain